MKSEIIYEDREILVIRKPAGLAVQTARLGETDCVSELKNYLHRNAPAQGEPYLGVVHRLDQPVEGLLVFGKTKAASAALSAQLTEPVMNKKYYAAACIGNGRPDPPEEGQDWHVLEDLILKDGRTGRARICSAGGKKEAASVARLRYRCLNVSGELAKLEIETETGRFHQIRAQMACHGMPLLGDRKYGTEKSQEFSRLHGVHNVALCAYRLEFKHPVTDRWEVWECTPQNPAFRLL